LKTIVRQEIPLEKVYGSEESKGDLKQDQKVDEWSFI